MSLELSDVEVRVLGALVEKEITTPEYYPLSLNALTNACNQKSNRDPVMTLDEDAVRKALRSLTDQYIVRSASGDSRVAKFEHRLSEFYNFHRHETAVLCVLMLRGPQTPGELRTRAERMYEFQDLDAVHAALNLLMRRDPPLVQALPRQPGTKESRFMHLLSRDKVPASATEVATDVAAAPGANEAAIGERIAQLETEVSELRRELETYGSSSTRFRGSFNDPREAARALPRSAHVEVPTRGQGAAKPAWTRRARHKASLFPAEDGADNGGGAAVESAFVQLDFGLVHFQDFGGWEVLAKDVRSVEKLNLLWASGTML